MKYLESLALKKYLKHASLGFFFFIKYTHNKNIKIFQLLSSLTNIYFFNKLIFSEKIHQMK